MQVIGTVNDAIRAGKQEMYENLFGVVKETGRSVLKGQKVNNMTSTIAHIGGKEFLMAEAKDVIQLANKDSKSFKYITENWGKNIQGWINDVGLDKAKKIISDMSPSLKEFMGKCFTWKF